MLVSVLGLSYRILLKAVITDIHHTHISCNTGLTFTLWSFWDQEEPTYFAIWGDNKAFEEVIISPAMLHEHLPHVVMEGLNKVRDVWCLGICYLLHPKFLKVNLAFKNYWDTLFIHSNGASQPCWLSRKPPILPVLFVIYYPPLQL